MELLLLVLQNDAAEPVSPGHAASCPHVTGVGQCPLFWDCEHHQTKYQSSVGDKSHRIPNTWVIFRTLTKPWENEDPTLFSVQCFSNPHEWRDEPWPKQGYLPKAYLRVFGVSLSKSFSWGFRIILQRCP